MDDYTGRREDRRLLTGAGQYTADIDRPGQLRGVFVRADRAHALGPAHRRRRRPRRAGCPPRAAGRRHDGRRLSPHPDAAALQGTRRPGPCCNRSAPPSPRTASASWASRWPWWSPTRCTRRRTRRSCWPSTTRTCPSCPTRPRPWRQAPATSTTSLPATSASSSSTATPRPPPPPLPPPPRSSAWTCGATAWWAIPWSRNQPWPAGTGTRSTSGPARRAWSRCATAWPG